MANQDPTWYMTVRKLNSKRDHLEQAALSSLRHGYTDEAQKYAQEANSLDFCKSSSSARRSENPRKYNTMKTRGHKSHPQIGGVVPVKVIRRRKRKTRRPTLTKSDKEKN